jgi:hypothetical protein
MNAMEILFRQIKPFAMNIHNQFISENIENEPEKQDSIMDKCTPAKEIMKYINAHNILL